MKRVREWADSSPAADVIGNVTSKQRWRKLTTEIGSSPLLPILGWTKVVESIVATGPLLNWLAYAVVLTIVYVFADELRERGWHIVEEQVDAMEQPDG